MAKIGAGPIMVNATACPGVQVGHPAAARMSVEFGAGIAFAPSMKTNAVRVLERLGVAYELREYEVDPDDLGAEKVARAIGLPAEQVYKTLLARGDRRGLLLAVIAADAELDFKAIARVSENRSVDLVPLKDVQPLTGYIRGGVTALACKKDYPVYADLQIRRHDRIAVSAGLRGLQIVLAPDDYLRAVRATVAAIARGKGEERS